MGKKKVLTILLVRRDFELTKGCSWKVGVMGGMESI